MSKKPTRSFFSIARTVVVAFAIAFIPFIYAGALTWANQDPTHNLDQVPAAIVNLDQPAKVGDKTIDLGKDLTDELVSSTKSNNFNWSEYQPEAAKKALADGDVLAVLTIPESFSANAASPGEAKPSQAQVAKLSIHTNDGANMISGSVAAAIAANVQETLSKKVSAEYLEQVYLGFSDIHSNISDASNGASELADGAKSAKDGSDSLVVGLTDLANGTVTLDEGAQSLATGASDAATGARTLSDGLSTLSTSATDLPDQATALNDGAAALSDGSSKLADGISSLSSGATTVSDGLTSAKDGATTVRDGLNTLAGQTPAAATGAQTLQDGIDGLIVGWNLLTDDQRQAALAQLSVGAHDLNTGITAADGAVQQLAAGQTALVGSSEEGTGLSALSDGATTLASGAATAATSATTLRDGAATLAAGTQKLADAAPTLKDAIDSAATGASTLADGVEQLSTGASDLSAGATSLDDGAQKASTGATDLANGITKLSDGSTELSDGLTKGVDEIPTYTGTEAKDLSDVTSDPVMTDVSRTNEVAGYGYGLAPYFLALSLWVGGMAFYMMFPAINRRALVTSRTSVGAALRSYLPGFVMGIAQSILVTFVLLGPVGIKAVDPWGLFGMVLLTSFTFIAINQALIALMGAPGRFFALVMIVLQLSAAGGTYPVQTTPGFFQAIHSWLPLTHAVEAFRSLIAGGHLGIVNAIGALSVWLLVALIATVLAHLVSRRGRKVRSAAVHPDEIEPLDDDSSADSETDAETVETETTSDEDGDMPATLDDTVVPDETLALSDLDEGELQDDDPTELIERLTRAGETVRD